MLKLKQRVHKGFKRPHKILLVVVCLRKYSVGHPRLLNFEKDINPDLSELLYLFGCSKSTANYPFWRAQKDGFWEVAAEQILVENKSGDVSKAVLCGSSASGGFKVSFIERITRSGISITEIFNYVLEILSLEVTFERKLILLKYFYFGLNYVNNSQDSIDIPSRGYMEKIEIEDDIYRFIAKNSIVIGESASDILKRLLKDEMSCEPGLVEEPSKIYMEEKRRESDKKNTIIEQIFDDFV